MIKKILAIPLLFIVSIGYSQYTLRLSETESDSETKLIKDYYRLVNKEKSNYSKTETYWSHEADLAKENQDVLYEINEEGNKEINERTYTYNGVRRLLIRDTRITKYQVPYTKTLLEEYYFKDDQLIFYYSKSCEILTGPDFMNYTDMLEGERAKEIRIYLKNGKIFNYLKKVVVTTSEEEIDANLLLLDMENMPVSIDSMDYNDYEQIFDY
jgi:hypothetical protein